MLLKTKWLFVLFCLFFCFFSMAGRTETGSTAGLGWRLYVPDGNTQTARPLVVMLHGCTQSAADFANAVGLAALADEHDFMVLFPEQSNAANSLRCWNWFETRNQGRSGEAAAIAAVTEGVRARYLVDETRIIVGGFSAGAAMAVIMAAAYPDLYTGVMVHSGLEFKAAVSSSAAFSAMSSGGPDPRRQGDLAYQTMGSRARSMPVLVFHGGADYTVATVNGGQVRAQWLRTNDWVDNGEADGSVDTVVDESRRDSEPGGRSYTSLLYRDGAGRDLVGQVTVDGMGHAWSGGAGGAFTDPSGPSASAWLVSFFGLDGAINDTTPPVTTADPAGGTYQNAVTVDLHVNEAAVTYYSADGTIPDTTGLIWDGPQTFVSDTVLHFFSVDTAGNREVMQNASYRIEIVPDTTPPTTLADPPGGTYSGLVSVVLQADEPADIYYSLDGSEPDAGSLRYAGPINIDADATLKFRAVDTAGNWEAVRSEQYSIQAVTIVILPVLAQESGTVGRYAVDGVAVGTLLAGDPGMFNIERKRIILSFDLNAVPAGTVLEEVSLQVCREVMSGSVSGLEVDVAATVFGGNVALSLSDFAASALADKVVTMAVPANDGDCVTVVLPDLVADLMATGDRLQLRLRAVTAVDFTRDEMKLSAAGASAPQLIITTR